MSNREDVDLAGISGGEMGNTEVGGLLLTCGDQIRIDGPPDVGLRLQESTHRLRSSDQLVTWEHLFTPPVPLAPCVTSNHHHDSSVAMNTIGR